MSIDAFMQLRDAGQKALTERPESALASESSRVPNVINGFPGVLWEGMNCFRVTYPSLQFTLARSLKQPALRCRMTDQAKGKIVMDIIAPTFDSKPPGISPQFMGTCIEVDVYQPRRMLPDKKIVHRFDGNDLNANIREALNFIMARYKVIDAPSQRVSKQITPSPN